MRMAAAVAGLVLGAMDVLGRADPPSTRTIPLVIGTGARSVGFTGVPAEASGIRFTNQVSPERYLTNQIYLNGSGVALGDVDGDGRPDVFLAAPRGRSALFRNEGGWRFSNQTASTFVPPFPEVDATGVVLADLDGDGDLDLVVNTVGQGTRLWWNDGHGILSAGPVLNAGRAGESLALADADGDGDLDLYVANYRVNTLRDDPAGKFTLRQEQERMRVVAYNGKSTSDPDLVGRFYVTPSGVKENGEPDVLFLNEGQGQFTPVAWTGGAFLDASGAPLTSAPYDWGLSVMFRDVTGDGRPDLYVANDFESPDRFWINETTPGGPLRFRAASPHALRHTAGFSMGVDAADINRDGIDDFLVLDMLSRDHRERNVQVDGLPTTPLNPAGAAMTEALQFSANTLFLGRGDGTFAEIARLAGLAASEWSWTPVFLDVDLDGYEDLLVSNGHELEMMDADAGQKAEALKGQRRMLPRELLDLRRMFRRFDSPDAAFRNQGNLTFSDESAAWGFDARKVTHGMALADLDGDGDLDVVQNNLNAPPTLLRNEASAPRVAVRVRSTSANTAGIGARIRVLGGAVPEQSQVVMSGGRYLSADDPVRVFAAGGSTAMTVEAGWPSGSRSVVSNVPPNSRVEMVETLPAVLSPAPNGSKQTPLFVDESGRLGHESVVAPFNDFERQPLLPWSLSYPAPGATWADLDGDGRDDLVIGTGAGGSPAVFRNLPEGFVRQTNAMLLKPLTRDLTTILASGHTLLAGSSNYRDGRTNGGALRVYDLVRNATGESVLGQDFAVGPLALGDLDGDGTPEMFVGGRAIAGRYPEAAPSLVLAMQGGRFTVSQRIEALGLVNGAVMTDLDGDGDLDLLVATEWGPLRILRNDKGHLEPWVPRVQGTGMAPGEVLLDALTGWWTSVAAADLDADGRIDILAGNRGWNWFPVPRGPAPGRSFAERDCRRVYYGDFDGKGSVDLVEAYQLGGRELPVRRADVLFTVFPQLREAFPTRASFGEASVSDVLKALRSPTVPLELDARWFASAAFLNRGDHFVVMPLPDAAQFAPVSGLAVADFDGDGALDLALAQNFFPVRPDEARQDAGRGLLLSGSGSGSFRPMSASASGFETWGDARAAAVADYNHDGRPDLVITQNAGPTRLFRNDAGRPGIRVALQGSSANPGAIGARLRLLTAGRPGPVQEIQSGTGWLSVDSPSKVLTSVEPALEIEVRWPSGPLTRSKLRDGLHSVRISADGSLHDSP